MDAHRVEWDAEPGLMYRVERDDGNGWHVIARVLAHHAEEAYVDWDAPGLHPQYRTVLEA